MPRKQTRAGYWTYLYFVQSAAAPHLVKIGQSTRPAVRIEHLMMVCPVRLVPIYLVKAHQMAHEILHAAFADQLAHGEWFRPHDNLKRLVREWKSAKVDLLTPDVMQESIAVPALSEYLREYRVAFEAGGMGRMVAGRRAVADRGELEGRRAPTAASSHPSEARTRCDSAGAL